MSEEIFELERPFERTELAALFQGFASALTDGQPLTVETEDGLVSMDVPERVRTELELELEVESDDTDDETDDGDENHDSPTIEFEIELEWADSSGESVRIDGLAGESAENADLESVDGDETETSDEAPEDTPSAPTGDREGDSAEDGADHSSGTDQRRSRFEVYRDGAEEWRWRLVHWNGNIIADSGEGYTTRRSAINGLESVRHNAPGAKVDRQDRN